MATYNVVGNEDLEFKNDRQRKEEEEFTSSSFAF